MNKNELHNIAPILSELSLKESGFKVPNNYFNSIENAVFAEILASEINVEKPNFNTPENYFNSLEDKVIDKINSKPKVISLKKITKYIAPIAIAASFLIIFLINKNSTNITFESIASSEIEEFIDLGNIDYDAESLAIIFPNVELDDTNFISSLSDSDVLEYLNENNLEELFYEN